MNIPMLLLSLALTGLSMFVFIVYGIRINKINQKRKENAGADFFEYFGKHYQATDAVCSRAAYFSGNESVIVDFNYVAGQDLKTTLPQIPLEFSIFDLNIPLLGQDYKLFINPTDMDDVLLTPPHIEEDRFRSGLNLPVLQNSAIITAGVIISLIFGAAVYYTTTQGYFSVIEVLGLFAVILILIISFSVVFRETKTTQPDKYRNWERINDFKADLKVSGDSVNGRFYQYRIKLAFVYRGEQQTREIVTNMPINNTILSKQAELYINPQKPQELAIPGIF